MIEIRTDVKDNITVEETEKAKGIGTFWSFPDLQAYIEENKVNNDILHHLCMLSICEMQRIAAVKLKESELFRLCADLERTIKRIYYSEVERDYTADFIDDHIEFREEGKLLQKITIERFRRDLETEPRPKENAIQLINFALEGRSLNNIEKNKLADRIVQLYNDLVVKEIDEAVEEKHEKDNDSEEKEEKHE